MTNFDKCLNIVYYIGGKRKKDNGKAFEKE